MSKSRKRHRQPWWKNRRKAQLAASFGKLEAALSEAFPRGFCVATVELPPSPEHGDSDHAAQPQREK